MAYRQQVSIYPRRLTTPAASRGTRTAAGTRQLFALGTARAKHGAAVLGLTLVVVRRVPLVVHRYTIPLATLLKTIDRHRKRTTGATTVTTARTASVRRPGAALVASHQSLETRGGTAPRLGTRTALVEVVRILRASVHGQADGGPVAPAPRLGTRTAPAPRSGTTLALPRSGTTLALAPRLGTRTAPAPRVDTPPLQIVGSSLGASLADVHLASFSATAIFFTQSRTSSTFRHFIVVQHFFMTRVHLFVLIYNAIKTIGNMMNCFMLDRPCPIIFPNLTLL